MPDADARAVRHELLGHELHDEGDCEVSSGGDPPRGRPSWARKMAHYSASKFGMSLFWTLSNATGTDDSDVLEAVEALSEALAAEIDPAWNIKVSRI